MKLHKTLPAAHFEFFQLCLDHAHVGDERVQIGHFYVQVVETLLENEEFPIKLRPPNTECSDYWLMRSKTVRQRRGGGGGGG